jgi:hypothetical protein
MSFQLREPTPFAPNAPRIHYGRGGAGNFAPASTARNTQKKSSVPLTNSGLYTCGRGGAGNMHSGSERPMFSFDEEMARERLREDHTAPVFHVGRGGAGNYARNADGLSSDEPRDSTSSNESGASDMSKRLRLGVADRIADRISGSFHRKSGTYDRS